MTDDPIIIPRRRTSYHELTDSDRELVDAARRATSRAYAPYSHFHVGAAILLSDGSITSIGSKAFSGINGKAKITVPAKKLKKYKSMLQKKGKAPKSVKIKK